MATRLWELITSVPLPVYGAIVLAVVVAQLGAWLGSKYLVRKYGESEINRFFVDLFKQVPEPFRTSGWLIANLFVFVLVFVAIGMGIFEWFWKNKILFALVVLVALLALLVWLEVISLSAAACMLAVVAILMSSWNILFNEAPTSRFKATIANLVSWFTISSQIGQGLGFPLVAIVLFGVVVGIVLTVVNLLIVVLIGNRIDRSSL